MPILDVRHIEKHFGATRVLEDISFSLDQGQALAIIGSSGSGKTTLLRCLNFLETPDQGEIVVNGETLFDAADPATQRESEVRKKRLHFGLVFQSFNLFPQYTALVRVISVYEIIWMGESYIKKGLIWPLFYTAVFYLVVNGILTLLLGWAEKKLDYFK